MFAPNNDDHRGARRGLLRRGDLQVRAARREGRRARARPNADEPNRLDIRIEYVIAGKNDKRNLVFPFYLKNEDDETAGRTDERR